MVQIVHWRISYLNKQWFAYDQETVALFAGSTEALETQNTDDFAWWRTSRQLDNPITQRGLGQKPKAQKALAHGSQPVAGRGWSHLA